MCPFGVAAYVMCFQNTAYHKRSKIIPVFKIKTFSSDKAIWPLGVFVFHKHNMSVLYV